MNFLWYDLNIQKYNILIILIFLQLLSGSGQTTTGSAQSPVPANISSTGTLVGNTNNRYENCNNI